MSLHYFDLNPVAHLIFKTLLFLLYVLVMYRMAEMYKEIKELRHKIEEQE